MSKVEVEHDIVAFLNKENILQDLEMAAVEYEENVKSLPMKEEFPPPFRFLIKLDVEKIKMFSGKFYKLLLKEPVMALNMTKNVIYCAVVLIVSSVSLKKSDLQIVPHVINLPITNDIYNLFFCPSYGLESIRGMLIAKTTIATYVRTSFYKCETVSCFNNKWKRYSESISMICRNCCALMKEHVPSADLGEQILCQFLSLKAYHATGRFQALQVTVKDELCATLDFQVGEEYIITGRLRENCFHAMNLQPLPLDSLSYSEIPQSISQLHLQVSENQRNCPWSFVIALSSIIGSFIIPPTSFLHLKIGLILSLATMESNSPMPVLAVGSDSLNTQILFQAAGSLAERYVCHSASNSTLGGLIKPGTQPDIICQEAGQLMLSARGVCNLGDWSKYKKDHSNYICQTLESGQILFHKNDCGKTNLTKFVPLKCSVWTYWCTSQRSRNDILQLKTLINVFGIPFLAEEKDETELNKICWKNLNASAKNVRLRDTSNAIPTEDFKKFIKIINSKEVVLSDAASQLIRSYFVVSRRKRPHCLPLGAIRTITSLAEAHTRLAMREEVLYEDAAAIIYLYEEAMSFLANDTIIQHPKIPWNENEEIYEWMSKQIREFSVWLEDYISM